MDEHEIFTFPLVDRYVGIRMEGGFSALRPGRVTVARHATGCSPENHASIATARSVGFVPYGTSLVLSAPRPDLECE